MHFVDTDDKNKGSFLEQELTEERFFEQFAALEESLALLQLHMRDMSENAKLFGSLAMHIRRSVCPAAGTGSDATDGDMRATRPIERDCIGSAK
jgi:hypothetical protein